MGLEGKGVNVWIDDQIQNGAEWRSDIGEAIQGSEAIMFCMSPDAVQSKYCREEVYFASGTKVPIFPMVYKEAWGDLMETKGMKAILQRIQFTNFDKGISTLDPQIKDLEEAMEENKKPNEKATTKIKELQAAIRKQELRQSTADGDESSQLRAELATEQGNKERVEKQLAELKASHAALKQKQNDILDETFDEAFEDFMTNLTKMLEYQRVKDSSFEGVAGSRNAGAVEFHWEDGKGPTQDVPDRKDIGGESSPGLGPVSSAHDAPKYDAFLCFPKLDQARGEMVMQKLTDRGLKVSSNITAGDIDTAIAHLDHSRCCIFLQSVNAHPGGTVAEGLGNTGDGSHCADIIHAAYEANLNVIVLRFNSTEEIMNLMSSSMKMMLQMSPPS